MPNLKIFTDNIEETARKQIDTLLEQPAFKDCKVRIMPDVHAGAGCVIGFTADLGDKVVPNLVGVDIGCGMFVVELGKIDIDLEKLDKVIRENIPSGMNVYSDRKKMLNDILKMQTFISLDDRTVEAITKLESFHLRCYEELKNIDWLERSMGTLGGGNHFIEIDTDEEGNKYLVIHTGSRNLGKQVCEIYQKKAISRFYTRNNLSKEKIAQIIKECKENGLETEIQSRIEAEKEKTHPENIPKELCYLTGKDREDYLHDMDICQKFAKANRLAIFLRIMFEMGWEFNTWWHTTHNYIDFKDNIIRKGAISAKKGEKLIIPMNMRDGCIIGIGKGNEDWNYSAPHGAGRIMSRSQAKKTVSMQEYKDSMQGVYTTSVDESTIDESPMAYKPMQEIIDKIKDTVEIEKIIKPIYNFKAGE